MLVAAHDAGARHRRSRGYRPDAALAFALLVVVGGVAGAIALA